jgi:surfeit locus 1 family protein
MELAQRSLAGHRNGGRLDHSFLRRLIVSVVLFAACAGFAALGTWQVHRLEWKTALIERVNSRVHAEPLPAPGRERWNSITAESDEYRHVRVAGRFLHDRSTLVFASTGLGTGYWLLTPLHTEDGMTVLVNRGFVTAEQARAPALREGNLDISGNVVVNGLLRLSEPGGGYLRHNDAAANRWYSRDVQAISSAAGLGEVAPYFIDMDAPASSMTANTSQEAHPANGPVAGLTVIRFHNNHLVYALTWYALALMTAGIAMWLVRSAGGRRL